MLRTPRDSVCLICRSAARPGRVSLEPGLPWVSQRAFGTRQNRRSTPSRMILSDRSHVAQPPASRGLDVNGGGGGNNKRPKDMPAGPWAAMNRTVANIDVSKRPAAARTRDATPTSMSTRSEAHRDRDRAKDRDKKGGGRRPFKALNMQRALTTIGYGQRTSVKERIQEVESFDQFELLPVLKEAVANEVLKGMVDIKPTPVQRLAIPALLGQRLGKTRRRTPATPAEGRQEFLLAAETGSGKTLAYLLPALDALKKSEMEDVVAASYNERLAKEKARRGDRPLMSWIESFEPHPNTARPRVIILVPTSELVDQVVNVAKSISHVAKFKARGLSASYDALKNRRHLYNPLGVDVIVSTPHLLASIAHADPYVLSRVAHLIVDEADSLLDRSFAPETIKIFDRVQSTLKQLVLCSATIPKRLDSYLVAQFPNIERITTPNLHAIPRRVQLGVIDTSKDPYRNNKLLACADAVWSIGRDAARHESPGAKGEVDVKRIMVFVNERDTTREVADYLVSKGIDAVTLHRDTSEQRQSEMLASFTRSEPLKLLVSGEKGTSIGVGAATAAVAVREGHKTGDGVARVGRHLANTKVIVATDLASRGIDTLAVRHVVLYDVPHTTIDFIHRLGRAGRMGRRGRGIVLVGKDDRRDIVSEVKESMFMGQALV
ncbi:P-loop containing nucleoside triphosphate hydrolase protein [Lasiosphaeris hirsuta]|uniref:RNA helicase n=1 Tax=Lasiosphaeris hirsuta TaxID=260670 RepID=A0AA40DPD4_9PEZI|nr:P-loop containing nucleoside triphosphate hydrolase protein [Lasiosphaeris hirsuta]